MADKIERQNLLGITFKSTRKYKWVRCIHKSNIFLVKVHECFVFRRHTDVRILGPWRIHGHHSSLFVANIKIFTKNIIYKKKLHYSEIDHDLPLDRITQKTWHLNEKYKDWRIKNILDLNLSCDAKIIEPIYLSSVKLKLK